MEDARVESWNGLAAERGRSWVQHHRRNGRPIVFFGYEGRAEAEAAATHARVVKDAVSVRTEMEILIDIDAIDLIQHKRPTKIAEPIVI
jgi:hypothetical protein